MCLAVPGKIIATRAAGDSADAGTVGTVDFQGSRLDISLLFTPEAKIGDWVLVHAGFALNVLNEQEAMETWKYLEAADLMEMREESAKPEA